MTTYQWKKRMTADRKETWAGILWTLKLDGDIVDAPNANKILAQRLEQRGVAVNNLGLQLADMAQRAHGSLITREINGRLVKSIRLNAKKMPPNPFPPDEPVAETELTQPPPPPAADAVPTPSLPGDSVGELAAEMVGLAVQISLLAGEGAPVDDEVSVRLATALEEARKHRERADTAELTIDAQRARIRELERIVATLDHNLQAKLRNGSDHKETDREMRRIPSRR